MASDHLDDFSDEELAQRIRSGDLDAFKVLYLRYQDQVDCWVRAIVGSEDAKDIRQETLWKAYRHLSTPGLPVSNFRSWLFKIARNTSIDHLRKQGREPPKELDDDDMAQQSPKELDDDDMAQQSPENYVIRIENLQEVFEAIEKLRPHYREVLYLSAWGYSPEEIAQRLRLSLGSVRTYISDARRELRQTFPKKKTQSKRNGKIGIWVIGTNPEIC